jgi:hypothetical protein
VEVVCENCGVANREGTEFCLSCGDYLAWDRSVLVKPRPQPPPSAPPAAARPPAPLSQPAPPAEPGVITQPLPTVDAYRPGVAAPAPPLQPPPPAPATAAEPIRPAGFPSAPGPQQAAPGGPCPTCGRVNDPTLRFCAKCGQQLQGRQTTQRSGPGVNSESRWSRISQSRDRAARRAYRRSLPPLYRWRRVLIGLLVVALGLGGLRIVGRHPVRFALQTYDNLRRATVIVGDVGVRIEPPEASANGANPAALTDLSVAAWTMNWSPPEEGTRCGGAPGTGVIVLSVPPTRIREIDVQAGLPEGAADRPLEFRPKSIGVSFDGGPCHNLPLQDALGWQKLEVDSLVDVRTVRIGVDTAYAARPDSAKPLLSITEISLRSRPKR